MPLSRDIVAGLARCLGERAGLEPPAWVIEARAQARMAACGLTAAAYLELVSSGRGAAELAELIEGVRVGETRFFRHHAQIDALCDVVVPALAARGRRPLRVWSAGCATGEEPYTLAIVLAARLPDHPVSILATDLSDDALAIAAAAVYPRTALERVPEVWHDAFVADGAQVRVRPDLARRVTFERQNLCDAEPPRGCALVWCRNVLIYFGPEARRRAVERLVGALDPGGHLFVGYSESLRDVAELEAIRAGEVVMYVRRPAAARLATPAIGVPAVPAAAGAGGGAGAGAATSGGAAAGAAPVRMLRVDGACDATRLTAELAAALASPGLRRLCVDVDGAEFLADEVATILRRARAAAVSAGIELELRAVRPGPRRWLRRHGLDGDAP